MVGAEQISTLKYFFSALALCLVSLQVQESPGEGTQGGLPSKTYEAGKKKKKKEKGYRAFTWLLHLVKRML